MERRTSLVLGLGIAALAILFFCFTYFGPDSRFTGQRESATPSIAAEIPDPAPKAQMKDQLAGLLAKLRRNAATAGDFIQLRRELLADPATGIVAILDFLATGEDAATGQTFEVGPGGVLAGTPTLRLFLLDMLGQLARLTGSSAGAEFARQILEKKDSPDEWALALRNVAWAEPKSRAYLASKMHEMLDYEPWRATPTAGMLEAFDVAVYTGDPTFVPTLASLAASGTAPLRRSATVALDRLAETSSLAVMTYLNANPGEIADRPFVRADYFAKADLNDLAQRQAVEQYLDRTDVTIPEKTKFLHAIASPGSFVSDSLLSTSAKPDDGLARYTGIAVTTSEWLRANRFPALRSDIAWLQERVTSEE